MKLYASLALTLSFLLSIPSFTSFDVQSLAVARPTTPFTARTLGITYPVKRHSTGKLCRERPTPPPPPPSEPETPPTPSEPETPSPPENSPNPPTNEPQPPKDPDPENPGGGDPENPNEGEGEGEGEGEPESPEHPGEGEPEAPGEGEGEHEPEGPQNPENPDEGEEQPESPEEPGSPGEGEGEPETPGEGEGEGEHEPDEEELEDCDLSSRLFPSEYQYTFGFTTAEDVYVPGVRKVEINDGVLNVHKVSGGTSRNIVSQDGKTAWEAFYPAGSYKPSADPRGGFGWYMNGTDEFEAALADGATEVMIAYSVMFEEGFNFVKGGKLPGAFGGIGDLSYSCSGGRQEDRAQCFSLRVMWRAEGAGELYTYLPLTEENRQAQLASTPTVIEDDAFGFSLGRNSFYFPPGEWVTVAERVKLNSLGANDGVVQIWIDGEPTIELLNVQLRDSPESKLRGFHFQTFFGGGSPDWATPTDQRAYFADISGAVIAAAAPTLPY